MARVKGEVPKNQTILGGYEDFSRKMGAILNAIGVKGFLDDRKDRSNLSDTENALIEFVQAWAEGYPPSLGIRQTTKQLVAIAEEIEGFPLGRALTDRGKETAVSTFVKSRRGNTVDCPIKNPVEGKPQTKSWTIDNPSEGRPRTWALIDPDAKKKADDTGAGESGASEANSENDPDDEAAF